MPPASTGSIAKPANTGDGNPLAGLRNKKNKTGEEELELEVLRLKIEVELFIDFNLRKCDDVLSLIKAYVDYYNNERPMCCLGYKTPHQYKTDMGY